LEPEFYKKEQCSASFLQGLLSGRTPTFGTESKPQMVVVNQLVNWQKF
jgi:hypothetical protein